MVLIKSGDSANLSRRVFVRRILVSALSAAGMSVVGVSGAATMNSSNAMIIARLADVILPRTSTPSATDVNAHEFVRLVVTTAKGQTFASRFYRGASQLASQLERRYKLPLNDISNAEITNTLREILRTKPDTEAYWFLYRFKQLLVVGWALTKKTAESAFAYRGGIYQYLPRTESSQIIMSNYIDKEYLSL